MKVGRIIVSFVLVILFLVACLLLILFGYSAAWLYTYQAFTSKTAVAEVTISAQKKDNKGQYVDVKFTPLETQSALATAIGINGASNTKKDTQNYKLYGDVVYIGGPIIKFKDELILLNFKTIYKVGKIYARYDYDNELEKARTPDIASTYDINGGFTEWKSIHDGLTDDSLTGKILRMFIDTTQVSSPGMFTNNKETSYVIYITNTGFQWELK
jgi:hypothetical protein